METVAICLGTLVFLEAIVIFLLAKELRQRDLSLDDLADKAAELSAKTHISFDTAMQSLLGVYNAYGERLRK